MVLTTIFIESIKLNQMKEKFQIDINFQPAVLVDAIPEFFTDSLIKHDSVRRWCAVDKSNIDILVQRVKAPNCSFWKIDMKVHAPMVVEFKFGPRKKFNFYNLGQSVQVMFQPTEDVCFEQGEQKMVPLPKSQIMFLTNTSKTKLEVLLLDVGKDAGDLDRIEAEKAALEMLIGNSALR